ncbi:MAG: flagellar hook-length control protein FliK [bacterium]
MNLINSLIERLQNKVKISQELESVQCRSNKGLDFLKILFTELNLSLEERRTKDKTKGVSEPTIYQVIFINSQPPYQVTFSIDTLDEVMKEEIIELLKNQNIPEQFFTIYSKMKPGDEVIFKVNNKEIAIKKVSQTQVLISEVSKDLGPKLTKELFGASKLESKFTSRLTNETSERITTSELPRLTNETSERITTSELPRLTNEASEQLKLNNIEELKISRSNKVENSEIGGVYNSEDKGPLSKRVNRTSKVLEDNNFNYMNLKTDRKLLINRIPLEQETNFVEKLTRLVSERISGDSKTGEAILKLHPGISEEVRARIFLEEDKVNIRLVVSSERLRDLIESDIDSLRRSLLEKGLELGSISVYIMDEAGNFSYRRNRHVKITTLYSYKEEKSIEMVEMRSIGNLIDLTV